MNKKDLINTFEICNDVYVSSINSKEKELDTFFEVFVPEFMEKYKDEIKKIPYQINLIDELHANENAHSRILTKLLQVQDEKDYPILNSFFKYLGAPFSKLTEEKVVSITQETDKLLARDFNSNGTVYLKVEPEYENKTIYEDVDTEEQLKEDEIVSFVEKKLY